MRNRRFLRTRLFPSAGMVLISSACAVPAIRAQSARFDSLAPRNVQGLDRAYSSSHHHCLASAGTGTPCTPLATIYLVFEYWHRCDRPALYYRVADHAFRQPRSHRLQHVHAADRAPIRATTDGNREREGNMYRFSACIAPTAAGSVGRQTRQSTSWLSSSMRGAASSNSSPLGR